MNKKNKIIVSLIILLLILLFGVCIISIYYNYSNKEIDNNNDDNMNNSELLTNEEAIEVGKKLYDKVTEMYKNWVAFTYCGVDVPKIEENQVEMFWGSRYYKSNFSNLDDLRKYLKQWLSDDIIDKKVDFNDYIENEDIEKKYSENEYWSLDYIDYILKNNVLYCRLETGIGWDSTYLHKYDIKVDKIEKNKITYTIVSYYCKDDEYIQYEGICNDKDFESKNTTFVIERNDDGNFIVTDYTFYD